MPRRLVVCRNCKRFIREKVCPHCKSTNLSSTWKGVIILLNPESEVGKILGLHEPGKYALYVG